MTVSFDLDEATFREINHVWAKLRPAQSHWRTIRLFRAFVATVAVMALGALTGRMASAALYGMLAGAIMLALAPLLDRRDTALATENVLKNASFARLLGPRTISLTAEGVRSWSSVGERLVYWSAVEAIHDTPTHLFIKIPGYDVYGIPKSAFATQEEATEFLQTLAYHKNAANQPPITAQAITTEPAAQQQTLRY